MMNTQRLECMKLLQIKTPPSASLPHNPAEEWSQKSSPDQPLYCFLSRDDKLHQQPVGKAADKHLLSIEPGQGDCEEESLSWSGSPF